MSRWARICARAAWCLTCSIPRSSVVRGSAAVAILIGARCFVEAVAFALIAEGFLWRNLSIARGAVRWGDSRNALLFAGTCIGLAALASGPIDHGPLAFLALLVVALSGLALSLARTTEELALARGTRGVARASSATGVSFVIGIVAILAAAFVPVVQDLLSAFGTG